MCIQLKEHVGESFFCARVCRSTCWPRTTIRTRMYQQQPGAFGLFHNNTHHMLEMLREYLLYMTACCPIDRNVWQ
jgi:hypothetical protein